jgi:hypothetical protein
MGDAVVIAFGKKKKPSGAGLADAAFDSYMKEKGKAVEAPAAEEEVSAAEEEGKSAALDLAEAVKKADGEAIWTAYKRMAAAERARAEEEEIAPEASDDEDEDDED